MTKPHGSWALDSTWTPNARRLASDSVPFGTWLYSQTSIANAPVFQQMLQSGLNYIILVDKSSIPQHLDNDSALERGCPTSNQLVDRLRQRRAMHSHVQHPVWQNDIARESMKYGYTHRACKNSRRTGDLHDLCQNSTRWHQCDYSWRHCIVRTPTQWFTTPNPIFLGLLQNMWARDDIVGFEKHSCSDLRQYTHHPTPPSPSDEPVITISSPSQSQILDNLRRAKLLAQDCLLRKTLKCDRCIRWLRRNLYPMNCGQRHNAEHSVGELSMTASCTITLTVV